MSDRITTATVSGNEAAQLAAIALSTEEFNTKTLEDNVHVLFHACPESELVYSTKWHTSYAVLHIPDDLEQTSVRVVQVSGINDRPSEVDVDGTSDGKAVLDRLMARADVISQLDAEAPVESRCVQ